MPLIAGLIALFGALANGIGAALAYFASKWTKQVLMLAAWTTGLVLLVNQVIDLLADNIGANVAFPTEAVQFYHFFMPDNFLTVISTIITVEVAVFSFRLMLVVADKYLTTLSQ